MKGVPLCAEVDMVLPTELPEEGLEFVTSRVVEENPLADCQKVESIVPEGSRSVEEITSVSDAAVHDTVSRPKHMQGWFAGFSTCLRHLGDRLAASPTYHPDLTPYNGELVSDTQSVDTWETWDTYSYKHREYRSNW